MEEVVAAARRVYPTDPDPPATFEDVQDLFPQLFQPTYEDGPDLFSYVCDLYYPKAGTVGASVGDNQAFQAQVKAIGSHLGDLMSLMASDAKKAAVHRGGVLVRFPDAFYMLCFVGLDFPPSPLPPIFPYHHLTPHQVNAPPYLMQPSPNTTITSSSTTTTTISFNQVTVSFIPFLTVSQNEMLLIYLNLSSRPASGASSTSLTSASLSVPWPTLSPPNQATPLAFRCRNLTAKATNCSLSTPLNINRWRRRPSTGSSTTSSPSRRGEAFYNYICDSLLIEQLSSYPVVGMFFLIWLAIQYYRWIVLFFPLAVFSMMGGFIFFHFAIYLHLIFFAGDRSPLPARPRR